MDQGLLELLVEHQALRQDHQALFHSQPSPVRVAARVVLQGPPVVRVAQSLPLRRPMTFASTDKTRQVFIPRMVAVLRLDLVENCMGAVMDLMQQGMAREAQEGMVRQLVVETEQ
jgi:hypothetical protein